MIRRPNFEPGRPSARPPRVGRTQDGDDIYNGAGDNASGTAVLMEIAGLLRSPPPARSGSELFYRAGGNMMVVEVDTEPGLSLGEPRARFEDEYSFNQPG